MTQMIVGNMVYEMKPFPAMVYHPYNEARIVNSQEELNAAMADGWYRSASDFSEKTRLDHDIKELQAKLDDMITRRIEMYGELEPEDIEDAPAAPIEDHTPAPRGTGKPGRPKKTESD